jgi:hypothetical protein
VEEEVAGSGNSNTDSLNFASGADYQLYTAWIGSLVRVTYSGLSQSVFRLDRVKSSSCDSQSKITVYVYCNTSYFMSFNYGSSSPEVAEFCPTLRLVYFISRA